MTAFFWHVFLLLSKSGRSTPSTKTLQKIADYFGVTVDYLMTGKNEQKEISLSSKDERDIAKRLESTLNDLESSQEALMFSGEPLDDETRELLKASLENSIRTASFRRCSILIPSYPYVCTS